MKVKLDENVPALAADALLSHGHDVQTVAGEHLVGSPDEVLMAACRREDRLLFTFDLGFGDARAYPPGSHPGIVLMRLADQRPDAVVAAVRRLLATTPLDDLAAALTILSEERVRVRRRE